MKQKHKKIGITIAVIGLVFVLFTIIANYVLKQKLTNAINGLPDTVKVDYADLDIGIWSGNLEISSPNIVVYGETTQKTLLNLTLKTITIKDIGYWDYLFNDKISVSAILADQLVAQYSHNPNVKNKSYERGFLDNIKPLVQVDKIAVTNADVLVTNYQTDSLLLSLPKFNFEIEALQLNPKASSERNKITYGNFYLTGNDFKWAVNTYDNLRIDDLEVTNDQAIFQGFKFRTKYDKDEYSTLLKQERDHFDLKIQAITFSDLDFGFNDAERLYLKSDKVLVNSPNVEIYRDKLVADDHTHKPLYSKMLRELDIELGLDTIQISNGTIAYLEKVNSDKPVGRLDFSQLDATISNLGNTYNTESTSIAVNSRFINYSPLKVNWNFRVSDTTDQFVFKADLGRFQAAHMDQFSQPNLNVDFNGELQQTYFTISGGPQLSRIDLKIKYDDFEVLILKKDGKEKNKFLSTIVNIFVSKDSEADKTNFRYGQSDHIERDVTKSVFNYVWLNIKQGLLSAMTGDGKKED